MCWCICAILLFYLPAYRIAHICHPCETLRETLGPVSNIRVWALYLSLCVYFSLHSQGSFFRSFFQHFFFPHRIYECMCVSSHPFFCVLYLLDFVLRQTNKRIRHMHVKNEKITLHTWATRERVKRDHIDTYVRILCLFIHIEIFSFAFFFLLWFCFLSSVVDASNFFSYYENEIEIEKKKEVNSWTKEKKKLIPKERTNE